MTDDQTRLAEHNKRYRAGDNGDRPDDPPPEYLDALVAENDPVPILPESFRPVDLGPYLTGTLAQPEPTIMRRDDGLCLLYPGQVNGIHGDSGTGKGWTALFAVTQQLAGGRAVMIVDTEDVPTSIIGRLRQLGATDLAMRDRLIYVRPTDPFGMLAVDHLVGLVDELNVSLVVIDSIGECFGLDGIDENHDSEVGPWLRRVARPLADAGAAVLLVDHSTKANDNPLHPSGSKRKRAAIGGASYLVTAPKPLTRDHGGRLRLTCAKDRHGTYRRSQVVGDLVLDVGPLGTRVELYAPDEPIVDDTMPIVLAARSAVAAVKAEGAPMSRQALVEAMAIKCKTDLKRGGIDLAVGRGALLEEAGKRGARLYTYVSDLPGKDTDAPPD